MGLAVRVSSEWGFSCNVPLAPIAALAIFYIFVLRTGADVMAVARFRTSEHPGDVQKLGGLRLAASGCRQE